MQGLIPDFIWFYSKWIAMVAPIIGTMPQDTPPDLGAVIDKFFKNEKYADFSPCSQQVNENYRKY
jgi:hypothetical protein